MSMGVALLIASIVGIIASTGSAIYTQHKQNESVDKTNETNKEINATNNEFNAEQAEITRETNAEEAQKQRDWEERMSNTAIQRKAADLQAAGFNPNLAIASGGASTPVAASSSGGQANASGYIPMRAYDYSPMAALSNNLGHMVTSAGYIARLESMSKNNPQIMNTLGKMSLAASKGVTGAGKMDNLGSLARSQRNYVSDKEMAELLKSIGH